MRFFLQEALDLFQRAGARISDGNRVRIPTELVEAALQTAPRSITVFGRNGRPAMTLDGKHSYLGLGSNCPYVSDASSSERRKAVLDDLVKAIRLADSLPNLDFVMPLFLPSDAVKQTFDRYQMEVMLAETTKPIIFCGLNAASIADAVEMASIVAEGKEAYQREPFMIHLIRPASALEHDQQALKGLLLTAERNLPLVYRAGDDCDNGMLDPAAANAGELAGLVLSQLKREGAPFIRSAGPLERPDPGRAKGDDDQYRSLPSLGSAACSGAKLFDAQAAAEVTLSLLLNALGPVDLVRGAGCLDANQAGSLGLVAFCDELYGRIRQSLAGQPLGESPNRLYHRESYADWLENGATSLQERADQVVKQLLEAHEPESLPTTTRHRIKGLIHRANASVRWTSPRKT